ncbi:MAG: diguanylate cyclase [Leptospiraceae bacterium]|nr:diguanylate cyclase [Leptospiraceae bacterium]
MSDILRKVLVTAFIGFLYGFGSLLAVPMQIRIGVLSLQGEQHTKTQWAETANYLSSTLENKEFIIVPLSFQKIKEAVEHEEVDYIILNPALYTELSASYNISPIASMKRELGGFIYSYFSSSIFTLRKNTHIREFKDIYNKQIAAVSPNSLGGWLMAKREFLHYGISPDTDFKSVEFFEDHRKVVEAVKSGQKDVGIVRFDILALMQSEGLIKVEDFYILHGSKKGHFTAGFPLSKDFSHSTDFYPEWPFCALPHTSQQLNRTIAISLFSISSNSKVAKISGIYSWTPPLNYQSVNELYRELRIGPFKKINLRFSDVFENYSSVIIIFSSLFFVLLSLLIILVFLLLKLHRLNQKIQRASEEDILTGLPNRRLFDFFLGKCLSRADRNNQRVGILFIDLDDFKYVNDNYGHRTGDLILKQVAERFKKILRSEELIARQGGDEFIAVFVDVAETKLEEISKRFIKKITSPFYLLDKKSIIIGCSIGISIYPEDGKDVTELIHNADLAMYEAKRTGKNQYRFFSRLNKT